MKYLPVTITVLTLALAACSSPQPEQKAIPAPVAAAATDSSTTINIPLENLAMTTDTICGMSLTDGIGDTLNTEGKIYGFCSTGCKESFAEQLAKK